jgi:hypothetical protein
MHVILLILQHKTRMGYFQIVTRATFIKRNPNLIKTGELVKQLWVWNGKFFGHALLPQLYMHRLESNNGVDESCQMAVAFPCLHCAF